MSDSWRYFLLGGFLCPFVKKYEGFKKLFGWFCVCECLCVDGIHISLQRENYLLYLFINLFICLFIYPFTHLFTYLFYLFIYFLVGVYVK